MLQLVSLRWVLGLVVLEGEVVVGLMLAGVGLTMAGKIRGYISVRLNKERTEFLKCKV